MMEEGSCMAIRYFGWCNRVRAKVRVRASNASVMFIVYVRASLKLAPKGTRDQ